MFLLAWILVGGGVVFDIFELVRRCVQIAKKRGDVSATPLFGFLVSFTGVVILRVVRLPLDSVILLSLGVLFLHVSMQTLFPFLLRAPFNYFAGHKGSLFDPLSLSYKNKDATPPTASVHDEQVRSRKRVIHGP